MRGEISNAPQGSRLFLLQCLMWRGQNSRELSESRVVPRATAADERYIPVPLFLPTREAPRTSRGHSCRIKKKKKQMDASCGHHLKLTGYWPLVSRVEPSTLEGKTKIWRDAHSGWKFSNASIVLLLVCTNGGLLHKCHQGWVMAFLHTGITVTCSVTDAFLKVGA